MPQSLSTKQNLTLSLNRETVRKAKILAAQRSTSISGLLAEEIERLVAEEDDWLRAERSALAMLTQGFPLGGRITATRDELHER